MKTFIKKQLEAVNPMNVHVDDGYNKYLAVQVKQAVISHYDAKPFDKKILHQVQPKELELLEYLEEIGIELLMSMQNVSPAYINGRYGYKCIIIPIYDVVGYGKERFIKLCHECGHMFDHLVNYAGKFEEFGDLDENQTGVMVAEMSAWHYGEMLMEELGFFDDTNNKFYAQELKEYCIDTYAESAEEYAYYLDNQKEIVENHEKGIMPDVEFEPENEYYETLVNLSIN